MVVIYENCVEILRRHTLFTGNEEDKKLIRLDKLMLLPQIFQPSLKRMFSAPRMSASLTVHVSSNPEGFCDCKKVKTDVINIDNEVALCYIFSLHF